MAIPIPIIDRLLDAGTEIIKRKWPDPKDQAEQLYKLQELAQRGELAELQAHVTLLSGQLEINKEEAKHASLFVAGARPFAMWVGGLAFAYASILEPFMRFIAVLMGYTGEFPELDTDLTVQVLLGLLGLGVMRSFDKTRGTETKGIK